MLIKLSYHASGELSR